MMQAYSRLPGTRGVGGFLSHEQLRIRNGEYVGDTQERVQREDVKMQGQGGAEKIVLADDQLQ